MYKPWVLVLATAAACSVAAADHEQLGDAAFRERRYDKALAEYQAAQRSGARSRVWAKAGVAALKADDYSAAIDAFVELADADPSRVTESAIGLERAIRVAESRGPAGAEAVTRAVLAIRRIAPERPLGRLSELSLAQGEVGDADALGLLPPALATAANSRSTDSLLLRYADAQRAMVACDGAAKSYRTLLRRSTDGRLRDAARTGLVQCAVLLGQDALAARQAQTAEQWFQVVLGLETATPSVWLAQLGIGDARLQQGDALGAAVAYQSVVSAAGVSDTLRAAAVEKLNGLGAASTSPPSDGGT